MRNDANAEVVNLQALMRTVRTFYGLMPLVSRPKMVV